MIDFGNKEVNESLKVNDQIIYHYTAAAVLPVFFRPGADLYCTNTKTLNDPAEIFQGAYRFADFLFAKKGFDKAHRDLLKINVRESLDSDWADTWVMSFSSEGDSLSQWRGYVPGSQGGFAIGFSVERLAKALSAVTKKVTEGNRYPIPNLTRCWYDEQDGKLIEGLFEYQYDKFKAEFDAYRDASRLTDDAVRNVMATVIPSVAHIKHKAFREEREARIVLTAPVELYPRVEILGNKPRMPVCLPDVGVELHALVERIIVSPHGNTNSLMAQANWLRRKCGGGFEVVRSEIPYDPSR